eukprot:CAMPEP_0167766788 /NCGR_PEP_ID=MMETSP0110_2-20121227/15575_1 /TAXON_ID=629695 /ORGANISM="Gymnochlora sp., Strain CCMP2014" /LENGTH=90 /DNA_ID=CAMNT_0007654927 /DNA_START=63 /DNA_END=335 /DNA_ORIENTATION=+
MELQKDKCEPCSGLAKAVSSSEIEGFLKELPEWELFAEEKVKKIRRKYRLKNFLAGISFFNDIARIAEDEKHHPDLHLNVAIIYRRDTNL